jgi:hypothetical protein
MLLERLAQKRQIRIDNGWPQWLGMLEALHFNGAPHRFGMDVQGWCNRAGFPMLGVKGQDERDARRQKLRSRCVLTANDDYGSPLFELHGRRYAAHYRFIQEAAMDLVNR